MSDQKDNPLFMEMLNLSNGENEEDLLFFISNHQELLNEDPIRFIGYHVSYYANKEDVVGSLNVVNIYKEKPYISMEVEEFLDELKKQLLKLNDSNHNEYNDEQIKKFLYSKNENAIVSALHILSKKNIRNYLPLLREFLLSEQPYKFKTLGIFILIEQHIEEEIIVSKDGLEYTITPYLLDLPFDSYAYNETKQLIEKSFENESVISTAIEILNTVQIKNFPESFLDIDSTKFMADIFISIAKSFLGIDYDMNIIENKYQVSNHTIQGLMDEIKTIFNS